MRQAVIVTVAAVALTVAAGLNAQPAQAASNGTTQIAPLRLAQNTDTNAFALLQDIQRLREQVRSLRGEIQSLQHQLDRSQRSRKSMYQRLDQRLTALEQGGGTSTSTTVDSAQVEQAYNAAFDALRKGEYGNAIKGFAAFVEKYPNTSYSDQALYWLGQARYVQGDLSGAMEALQKMTSQFPNSDKIASALLRMGMIQQTLGKKEQAQALFQRIIQNYPNSDSAAKAQQRQQGGG